MGVQGEQNEAVHLGGTCFVISHKQFYFKDGKYCSEGGFNKYMEVLAEIFDRIILAVPVDHEPPSGCGAPIKEGIVEFVEMPTDRHRYPNLWLLHPVGIAWPIARAIRQADLVHVMLPGYVQLLALLLTQLLGKPRFCLLTGDWEYEFAVSRKAKSHPMLIHLVRLVHRAIVRYILRSGLVLPTGDTLARRYRRYGPNVVPNYPSTFSESQIRTPENLGPLHQPWRILFVGRLDYKKGVQFLIKAMAELRDSGQIAAMTIVGTGPYEAEFRDLARKLNLLDDVRFLGHVSMGRDLWQVYREHDVFVLPSLHEAMGKVILEAYANGLPVVASRVGGIPDIVSEDNGILVPPEDSSALAAAIRRILTDDAYRQRLVYNNLQFARERTMEAQARRLSKHVRRSMPTLYGAQRAAR